MYFPVGLVINLGSVFPVVAKQGRKVFSQGSCRALFELIQGVGRKSKVGQSMVYGMKASGPAVDEGVVPIEQYRSR